jgi:hypothetical protein
MDRIRFKSTLLLLSTGTSIKSNADLFFFYQRIGYPGTRNAFETTAAVNAGNAVRAEVRAFQRKPSHF